METETKKPARLQAKRAIAEWNRKIPPGSPVRYLPPEGAQTETKTRSEAALAHPDSSIAVILVEGVTGYVELSCVFPRFTEGACRP